LSKGWILLGVVAACGRVDFGALTDVAPGNAPAVAWVQPFTAKFTPTTSTLSDTFTAAAAQAGDAVVIHAYCHNSTPTGVSIAAPGWSFALLGLGGSNGYFAASLGAIAPDAASATFTVTWTSATNCDFIEEIGDEFTGNSAMPFDAHAETATMGACDATVITQSANDAVWGACTTNFVSAVGPGFSKGADDGDGDWSEHEVTADPANTPEQVTFQATAQAQNVMTAVAIQPR
jgi:hypothetical protein